MKEKETKFRGIMKDYLINNMISPDIKNTWEENNLKRITKKFYMHKDYLYKMTKKKNTLLK